MGEFAGTDASSTDYREQGERVTDEYYFFSLLTMHDEMPLLTRGYIISVNACSEIFLHKRRVSE